MSEKDYLKDISEIKNMMSKSSKFISLSGLSGILAGIYALIGALIAKTLVTKYNEIDYLNAKSEMIRGAFDLIDLESKLILIALIVAISSISTAFLLTKRKASKQGVKIWDATTKRLLFNFLVPLATGGIFSLTLLNQGFYGFVAPATLIFYGLSLFSANKYTIGNIKYLGIAEIILGLIAMNYIGYGLYFWAIGFGVFHIIYGTMMYFKYDRESIEN